VTLSLYRDEAANLEAEFENSRELLLTNGETEKNREERALLQVRLLLCLPGGRVPHELGAKRERVWGGRTPALRSVVAISRDVLLTRGGS